MDPVILTFKGYQLRYFGILVAVGLVILFWMLHSNLKQAKIRITRDELLNWLIIVLLYGVMGARIYYVFLNLDYYFGPYAQWYEFMAIWRGGLELNGGLVFAVFALWILSLHKRPRLEKLTDQIVPPLFIVYALARIGNFINGESLGYPTEKIVGFTFKYGPASKMYSETAIHPVMLYEAVLCLIGFLILNGFRTGRYRNGFTTACAVLWYSLIRIVEGVFSLEGATIFGQDESVVFGSVGLLVSCGIILGKKLYKKLPSPDEQFPSTRNWSI